MQHRALHHRSALCCSGRVHGANGDEGSPKARALAEVAAAERAIRDRLAYVVRAPAITKAHEAGASWIEIAKAMELPIWTKADARNSVTQAQSRGRYKPPVRKPKTGA